MKALIIDLSTAAETRVLQISSGGPANVQAAWQLAAEDGEDRLAVLSRELRAAEIIRLPAYVIPPRNLVASHLLALPRMPEREALRVIEREILAGQESAEKPVIAYSLNRVLYEKDVEKHEFLSFSAPKSNLFSFLDQLKEAGLNPAAILPEQYLLQGWLELLPDFSANTCLIAIEIHRNRMNLNLFAGRAWALQRDFIFSLQEQETLQEEDLERIGLEINRTIQFFKQKNRGFSTSLALVYGDSPVMRSIADYIREYLGIETISPDPAKTSKHLALPGELAADENFLSAFQTTLAAVLPLSRKKRKKTPDLIPQEFRDREKTPARLAGLFISAGIIVVILSGATIQLQRSLAGQKANSTVASNNLAAARQLQSGIEQARNARAAFLKTSFIIDYPVRSSYRSAELAARLSRLVDARTRLLELTVVPAYHYSAFKLKGVISAEDSLAANRVYLDFMQALKNLPGIHELEAVEARIDFKLDQDYASATLTPPPGQTLQPRLHFNVSGKVENQ